MSVNPASVEITLLCCAATAAMRAGRFPRPGDPFDKLSEKRLQGAAFRLRGRQRCWTSPARSATATVQALGLDAALDPLLDEFDPGEWAGLTIEELASRDPAGVAAWLSDVEVPPPGGESDAAVLGRAGRWLDQRRDQAGVVAVTHAAVIRAVVVAALGVPAAALRRIDIAPLSLTSVSGGPGRWRLGCLNVPLPTAR